MKNFYSHKELSCSREVVACLFLLSFVIGGILSGCNSQKNKLRIGFSQLAKDGWRQSQLKEMKRELAFHPNAILLYKNAEKSSKRQVQQIKALVKENIDVLIVSPYKADSLLTQTINSVYQQGIPVIFVDRKTNSPFYTTYIGSDNEKIGILAGNYIAKILNKKGKIVDIQGLSGSTPAIERHRGLEKALKQFPNIKIIKEIYGNWTDSLIPQLLNKYKDTLKQANLIFGQNDVMAHAAYKIFTNWGLQDSIKFVGVDASPGPHLGLSWVSKGILNASVLYPTGGKEAIRSAVKAAKGTPIKKRILLNTFIIDSANVGLMKTQTDKIISQQKDIKRQQNLLYAQKRIYKNQRNLLYLLLAITVLAIVLGSLAYISFRKNKQILKHLRSKNREILSQRDQIVRYSKQAEEATEAKLNFFTNISHEFRTPLTLIFGSIEEMVETPSLKTTMRDQLKMINKNADRLYHMVNQLIDYRKIDVNKMEVHASENNIASFLNEITSSFEGLAQKRNIDLRSHTKNTLPNIWFDPYMLDKVFFNLLSNAFKFTEDYGKIAVFLKQDGENIIIQVEDNGKGISIEEMEQIFNPFYQGKDNHNQGFGLGLPLAKKFIDLHHGSLSCINKKKPGALFEILLPIGHSHFSQKEIQQEKAILHRNLSHANNNLDDITLDLKEEQSQDDKTTGSLKNISILVIEDNEDLLSYLKKRLRTLFNVSTANNGDKGLEMIFGQIPDIIICDISMPGKNGLKLTQLIKDNIRTSHIPVILLTARSNDEQKIQGLETSADYYIVKPFKINFLLAVIKTILRNRASLKEHYTLNSHFESENKNIGKLDRKFLSDLNSYIDENIDNTDLSVKDLYTEMGLSRTQLYRKVKTLLDCSINELILKKRLNKAKQLLSEQEWTIAEIAYMVGFSSPSYFSSAFKKEFNVPPSQYNN